MNVPLPEVDHYTILGLPSGEEGAKLTLQDISKAYKHQALLLHPDKNRNNPNASANFAQLSSSYEILNNESSRKLFDDLLKIRREKVVRDRQLDAKRRRMVSDLEQRERAWAWAGSGGVDPERKARAEEERIMRKLDEEIKNIREMLAKREGSSVQVTEPRRETGNNNNADAGAENTGLDKSKVFKVSWEKGSGGNDYTAVRLRELFVKFGEVEDIVIRKGRTALVVMATKEGFVAASGNVIGDLSNPLLVLPLQPANPMPSVRAQEPVTGNDGDSIGNVVGVGFHAHESSILDKIRKKGQKQKLDAGETRS